MILFSGGIRFVINFLQFIGDNFLIKKTRRKKVIARRQVLKKKSAADFFERYTIKILFIELKKKTKRQFGQFKRLM